MLTLVSIGYGSLMPAAKTRQKRDVPTWAAALRIRRNVLGKSQEDVALDSGILNQTTVSELEGGKYEIGNLTAARVAGLARGLGWTLAELETALGINLGLTGYPPSPPPLTPAMQPRLIAHAGSIGAGYNPRMHALDYPEKRWMPNHPALEGYRDEDLMTLDVVGDSMADDVSRTTVPEGSTVYLHIRLEPQPGDIVAVWLEKEHVAVLKIFSGNGTHVVLRSYNDHHPPIVLSPDDQDVVQGVYLAHLAGGRRAHNAKVKYRK